MRVIQVGIGTMGDRWLRAISAVEGVEAVAYVDINPTIIDQQVAKYGLDRERVFTTLAEAAAAVEADGVLSIIPPDFRIETARTCVEYGLPLLTEKPLALTMDDAREFVDIVANGDILCMVSQDYRYKVTIQTLKSVLDSGELGQINTVVVEHYFGLRAVGFHERMPYPLLQDMSIHHFDLMRYLIGGSPVSVYGRTWSAPWNPYSGKRNAAALFEFPDETQVIYNASWSSTGLPSSWEGNWRIECENGVITLRDGEVRVQRRKDIVDGLHYQHHNTEIVQPVEMEYAYQEYMLHAFRQAVLHDEELPTPAADNIHSLQMVFDVIASAESGNVIRRDAVGVPS